MTIARSTDRRRGDFHYHRSGQGPSVVLIHAGFLDHRMWADAHGALSANYDVISYDVRGAGRSSRDLVAHSPSDDLAALLDELGIERAAIVGASMGARIALEFSALHPNRTRASVLCSLALPEFVTSDCNGMLAQFVRAVTEQHLEEATQLFTRMWFDGRREASSTNAAQRGAFVELIDLTFAETFVHQQWRTLEQIGPAEHIATPTLFLTGQDDWPDIHRTVAALDASMPDSRSVSIEGAAHMVNLDQPQEVFGHIDQFVSAHP